MMAKRINVTLPRPRATVVVRLEREVVVELLHRFETLAWNRGTPEEERVQLYEALRAGLRELDQKKPALHG